ncbi:MAG: TetR/AcrR family transcriptional regulator [Microthrixaceae bacterium]|nr:TetR/AcrR family transcriptional regulator [Microthrixaceae bacterium]
MARPPSTVARNKLMSATMEILATEGVGSVNAEEVARRSGVAKTTLYRHFGTTDALVFAVVEQNVAAAEPPDTGTLRGDLAEIQRRYLEVASPRQSRELFVWMVAKSIEDPVNRELFRRARVQPRGPTVIALQRAMARGEIDANTDVDLAMHVIQGPLISMRIVDNSDVGDDDLDTILDMTVRALGAVGPTGRQAAPTR